MPLPGGINVPTGEKWDVQEKFRIGRPLSTPSGIMACFFTLFIILGAMYSFARD